MTQVKFDFDPFQSFDLTDDQKADLLPDISDYLRQSILSSVGDAISPVSGRSKFPQLNKDYAEEFHRGDRRARLELMGDMLDSLDVFEFGDHKLRVTVGEDQQAKADGHNNFSGDSLLPERRFIPKADDGEHFKKEIRKGIAEIIKEYMDSH